MPRIPIVLSPVAIQQIQEILTAGKDVEIAVRNGRLVIWEVTNKKKYEAVVTPR